MANTLELFEKLKRCCDELDAIYEMDQFRGDEKVIELKKYCLISPEFLSQLKQIYIDINLLRWEDIDAYRILATTTDTCYVIEKVITGILIEEATEEQ